VFPPILGLLVLLGTLTLILAGLGVAVAGLVTRRPRAVRGGLLFAGGTAGCYALVWLLGLVTAEHRVLGIGQEAHFCGVDCHLHVSVVRVTHDSSVGVTLRFRSDAKQALEYPFLLTYEIVDDAGRRYPPSDGTVGAPLKAGETVEQELRFSVPETAAHPRLMVYYDSMMDYLVPGQANPLAQRRTRLDLGSA
jgi:hypothetical protein